MGASYSGLYEEGEVEHINVPPLPILMVTKTRVLLVERNDPKCRKYCIPTVLTGKKRPKCQEQKPATGTCWHSDHKGVDDSF